MNYNLTDEDKWLKRAFPIAVFSIFCSITIPRLVLLLIKLHNYKPTSFLRIVLGSIPVQLSLIIPIFVFIIFSKQKGFFIEASNRLKLIRWNVEYFFEAVKIELIIFIPLCILAVSIHFTLVHFGYNPSSPITILLSNADMKGILLIFFLSVFIAPLGEEIIFRRIFFSFSEKLMNRTAALIITSFIFATLHGGIVQLLPLTILGCILQKLYIKHESLFPCIVLHSFHNFIMMILFIITWLNF